MPRHGVRWPQLASPQAHRMARITPHLDLEVWQLDRIPNPTPRIPAGIIAAVNALVSVLIAPRCAACEALLGEPLDGAVCTYCWAAIRPITPPVCDGCGDPLPSAALHESGPPNPESRFFRCRQCCRMTRAIDRGRAVGEYDGALRQVIHAFKYDGRRSLAPRLAALMRTRGADLLRDADWVVPVPLHWRRRRTRGFNQARELARHLGVPLLDALERIRRTQPQIELPAARRHANVRGAFALRARRILWGAPAPVSLLRGTCVVLVDDVSTTGATLDACASVLKRGGVREVRTLTAARVVARPL